MQNTFGNMLRQWRHQAGLTLLEVSGRMGISVPHLSDIERGRRHPPAGDTIRMLAELLGKADQVESLLVAAMRSRDNQITLQSADEPTQRVLARLQKRIDDPHYFNQIEKLIRDL